MNRIGDGLARRIVVSVRRFLGHEADVVEPAGSEQARERAEKAEAVLSLHIMQRRIAEAGRRLPADGASLVLAFADIHAAELEHANAAFHAIAQSH